MLTDFKWRAVLFDLDGTLYYQPPLRALMALELLTMPLNRPSRAPARLRALKAYRRAQEDIRSGMPQDGSIADTQLKAAAAAGGLDLREAETVVSEWMFTRPLKYLRMCRARGVDELLTMLNARGIQTGLLSDYPAEGKLRALGLEGRFSPVLCTTAADINALKPDPRGFLRACEIWNLPPRDVLGVGDRQEADGAGAAAAGMPYVIVNRGSSTSERPGHVASFSSIERFRRAIDPR